MTSLNRTNVELKHHSELNQNSGVSGLNRTNVELKLAHPRERRKRESAGLNRTNVELKLWITQ